MKKTLVVFVAVLFLAAFVPRSAEAEVTFDLGIKGGVSLARIMEIDLSSGGLKDPSSTMTKPVFGGFVAINLNQTFTFQPEVYYLTQGGVWDEDFEGLLYHWVHTLRYIHIPLLAKIHLMKEGKAIPILFAGPAVDFLVSARHKLTIDGVVDYDEDFKSDLKGTNFSLVFGGGVEMMLDKLMLVLDIRYDLGLANIVASEYANDWSLKTKALMVMVGVGF